jgi:hypothetical protein
MKRLGYSYYVEKNHKIKYFTHNYISESNILGRSKTFSGGIKYRLLKLYMEFYFRNSRAHLNL